MAEGGAPASAPDGESAGPEGAPRVTLVLWGPPGEGKSTLGNLLAVGRTEAAGGGPQALPAGLPFRASDGFEAEGEPAAAADFRHEGEALRAIDTTGPCDTAPRAAELLAACAGLAPRGADAFVFAVQKGRLTEETSGQLAALGDAAGPGALARTVVAFTRCGGESSAQLASRCERAQNPRLRGVLEQVAAVVAVDASLPERHARDREALLAAARRVRAAHGGRPLALAAPRELARALQELEAAAAALRPAERREAAAQQVRGVRAGRGPLAAARAWVREAEQRQRQEELERARGEAVAAEAARARREAALLKGAAASVAARGRAGAAAGLGELPCLLACCAGACHEACDPCADELCHVLHEWRGEREGEVVQRFAEADASADAHARAAAARPRLS